MQGEEVIVDIKSYLSRSKCSNMLLPLQPIFFVPVHLKLLIFLFGLLLG
jgi:hypothetical protein